MSRANQWPYYKRYWGESEEDKSENLLDEVDQSESFGFEETEDVSTYDEADEIFRDELGVEDDVEREERVKRLGFDKNLDKQLKNEKKRGMCRNCFTKRRLSELEKQKMTDLIDEIILKKKKSTEDMVTKDGSEDSPVSKILMRNIESIKKIAEKEGISLNKLIKHLKEGE
jgi:predicted HicB family RNase H-like nuclease